MREPSLKWFMDTLLSLREELYGPMDDLSAYEPWSSNAPGVYRIYSIYLNTGLIDVEPGVTQSWIKSATEKLKKGDYTRPIIYFPCEFSRSAFYNVFNPLILDTIKKFIELEKKKIKHE